MAKKTSITNATAEDRKKWLEKAKKTRAKKKAERERLLNDLQGKDINTLLGYISRLDFGIRAMKVNKISEKDRRIILNILSLLEKM
jgi:hypothetical protein